MPLKNIPLADANLSRVFDPWNSASTGHQRSESRGPHGWREARNIKMNSQFQTKGNGKRISDMKLLLQQQPSRSKTSVADMLRNPGTMLKRNKKEEPIRLSWDGKTPLSYSLLDDDEEPFSLPLDGHVMTAEEQAAWTEITSTREEADQSKTEQPLSSPINQVKFWRDMNDEEKVDLIRGAKDTPWDYIGDDIDDDEDTNTTYVDNTHEEERKNIDTRTPYFHSTAHEEGKSNTRAPYFHSNTHEEERKTIDTRTLFFRTNPHEVEEGEEGEDGLTAEEHLTFARLAEDEAREKQKEADGKNRKIFDGLVIYINGSTFPLVGDHQLKQLLAENGANISLHLGRRKVTHVILGKPNAGPSLGGAGGGLAAGKLQREITKVRGKGIKYVGVEWALESLKAGKRLPEARFANLKVAARGQGGLLGAFSKADGRVQPREKQPSEEEDLAFPSTPYS
ncbi:hypothetical protein QBC35DRAFT_25285 [Podospora australis]|uniref:BRCT domain-containing protein n=1 Tax=Podospora australis TaxID=1536484 RepID=A0AAN6X0X5_9PEZI|nr:hypothetical protein QBC35DRAFT_25285 [Podospora australis]